jgi:hypothetical protein
VAAALLIWTRAWHPNLLLLLAVPTVVSCSWRLRSGRGSASGGFDVATLDVDQ